MEIASPFRPILQIRQEKQNQIQQEFAVAESRVKSIRAERNHQRMQLTMAMDELKRLNQSDVWDVPRVLSQREYVKQVQLLLSDTDAALATAEFKVESMRTILLDARQDVQAVENLMERERARFRSAAQTKERREFEDAMVTYAFRRREAA